MIGKFGTNESHSNIRGEVLRAYVVGVLLLSAIVVGGVFANTKSPTTFNHATYSSPITLAANNKLVWSVNPSDNSVSVIRTDTNTVIKNIKVHTEHQGIALYRRTSLLTSPTRRAIT